MVPRRSAPPNAELSRLERRIMDVLYQLGETPGSEVARRLSEGSSPDTVRVTLGILTRKGHVRVRKDGARNLYSPAVSAARVRRSALRHLLDTFFVDSHSKAVLTMLDLSSPRLSESDIEDIAAWVERAREERDRDELEENDR